jgi:hypothetical protein
VRVVERSGTDGAVHAHVGERQRGPRAAVAAGRAPGPAHAAAAAVVLQPPQVRLRQDHGPVRQVQGQGRAGEEGPWLPQTLVLLRARPYARTHPQIQYMLSRSMILPSSIVSSSFPSAILYCANKLDDVYGTAGPSTEAEG